MKQTKENPFCKRMEWTSSYNVYRRLFCEYLKRSTKNKVCNDLRMLVKVWWHWHVILHSKVTFLWSGQWMKKLLLYTRSVVYNVGVTNLIRRDILFAFSQIKVVSNAFIMHPIFVSLQLHSIINKGMNHQIWVKFAIESLQQKM